MIMMTEDRAEKSDQRLRQKTQDQTLMQAVMEGTGMSPWAVRSLPQLVSDIYLSTPGDRSWECGLQRYQCTAISEGAGKALADCKQVSVVLTCICMDDDISVKRAHGHEALRRTRMCRITEEAREQGGLLTQEDLGLLLNCSERTIRRDIAYLLKHMDIRVATRGYLKDIGPSVSHKGIAIRHWLGGKEPVEVSKQINHSLAAVERYISAFLRVSLLAAQGDFDAVAIACATKLSDALIAEYMGIYENAKDVDAYQFRFEEIDIMRNTAAKEQKDTTAENAAKKGALLPTETETCPPSIKQTAPVMSVQQPIDMEQTQGSHL